MDSSSNSSQASSSNAVPGANAPEYSPQENAGVVAVPENPAMNSSSSRNYQQMTTFEVGTASTSNTRTSRLNASSPPFYPAAANNPTYSPGPLMIRSITAAEYRRDMMAPTMNAPRNATRTVRMTSEIQREVERLQGRQAFEEEMLDLLRQIGNSYSGLRPETIMDLVIKHEYQSTEVSSSEDKELCCICQEEYVDGQVLGKLNCNHEFHFDCIKQWLLRKNSCPICKRTALTR